MRICIGSDHAGYELKTAVKSHLLALGHEVEDLGTYEPQVSVDYPDYGRRVAQQVAAGAGERGIVICGTGIGVSIAANKVHGIRAALCTDSYMARMARLHNDANVLALGGRVVGVGLALDIVDTFLTTAYEGGRHSARVEKLMALESEP